MEAVGAAANVIAIIDLSAKVVSVILQYSKEVKNAGDDIRRLRIVVADLENVSLSVRQLLDRPEGARLEASQPLLNAINDSQLQLRRLYEKLRPKTARHAMSRLGLHALRWPFESKEVEKIIQDLGGHMQTMNLALQVDQTALLLDMDRKALLARLEDQVATGASFDSAAEQHNSRCLLSTRVELLQQISGWAGNSSAEAVFWLNGMAGTGKSTISRTVAESVAREGRLGASFFFKRGETDRGSMAKFIPTIAADLTRRDPAVARHIKDTIENDPTIFRKAMREQFDKLIWQPLSAIQRKEPVVVVVDALDECDEENDIKLMIRLFSQAKHLKSVQLKIFLTSRPDLPMRLGFKAVEGKYQGLILHDVPSRVVEHDISLFLENELAKIRGEYNDTVSEGRQLSRDWPGRTNIQTLVQMAIPLFIFAATVCRFIADTRIGTPHTQLKKILSSRPGHHLSKLGATYLPVLDNLVVDASTEQREEILGQFRSIVGSIIILASPLSTPTLARILDIPQDEIDGSLDMLHSVLSVPSSTDEPVRLLHLSFRDFLVKKAEENAFWVDEAQTHRAMVSNCLRVMGCLRQDICQLQAPGTRRSAIEAQKINTHLPSELQYACLYWVYHMQGAGSHGDDCEQVYGFLKRFFLHWIEALSLIGSARKSLHLIKALQSLYKDQDSKPLSDFLDDAERFILAYTSTIDETPLQLYSSLLAFAPELSRVRTAFNDQLASWILLKPRVGRNWSQTLQTLEGHGDYVNSAAFSPNGTLIASASDDHTVRIWRADIGECVQILEGHSDYVNSAAFSPDGTLIASASNDQTVRLWRADIGECVKTLKGHSDYISSVAFSPDGTLIASASNDHTVRIWRADIGECVQTLEGHSGYVNSAAFSPDGTLIASASNDRMVRLWRADIGECVQTLKGHGSYINSTAFSPDGALIISASYDYTVRLWHADTGECVQTLEGYTSEIRSAAFSPDGTLIISASDDHTIRLWRADTGECVQTIEGHSGYIRSATFSPNGRLIVSASDDQTVRLWHAADIGECMQTLERHGKFVRSAAFSPDGTLIASASDDHTVRLWRADTGECVQTLKGHRGGVRPADFSPDGTLIASAFSDYSTGDHTVQVWRTDTGESVKVLKGHSHYISSIAFSPDGKLIASASDDYTVRLWRANTGECVQILKGHGHHVHSAAFSPDGTLIASASDDHTVRLSRTATGECTQTFEGHSNYVNSAAFSPDGTLIASASDDHTVRLWRADIGKCVQMLEGHSGYVRSAAFSPDGTLIASTSGDRTVRVWRAETGECVQNDYLGSVSDYVLFGPDTKCLLTDVGAIHIRADQYGDRSPLLEPGAMATSRLGLSISQDSCWVTWNGENIFWLPKDFRPTCSVILGSTVMIGSRLGRVIVMRFSLHELARMC